MTVAPPVIRGRVPDGYAGRVFYRLETFSYEGALRTVFPTVVKLVDQKLAQELAHPYSRGFSLYRSGKVVDDKGVLLPKWRGPLKGRISKAAPKSWPEFGSGGAFTVVSPRVRDVIEELEPGANFFIPIDGERTDGSGIVRLYVLIIGVAPARTALAMEANGIEHTVTDQVEPVFRRPDWLGWASEHFAYLDPKVVNGHALVHATGSLIVFSEELVRRLGNVLPTRNAFVPMGVADR